MAAVVSTRHNRGSEVELCYASPVTTIGATAARTRDGRRRKTRGSSDDSGEQLSDGLVDEDLRTGGPYLCAIPTRSESLPKYHPLHEPLEPSTVTS